jgi:3-oxoadipate enol-lactonase
VLRKLAGPRGAPDLVLLHGWTATADLNFFRAYGPLTEHHRLLAFDHRGHGTGIRGRAPFRLEDCADDVIAMADAIGLDRFVVLGYSMGGAVAQLVWRRHGERLLGLVLAATAGHFNVHRNERLSFLGLRGLAAAARLTPAQAHRWFTGQLYLQRKIESYEPWAANQASSHDWRMIAEAGRALGRFRSDEWLGEIDVPTAVIVTMNDEVVPLSRQIKLFESIPDAEAFRIDGGHDAAVTQPDRFVREVTRATASVIERAR